MNKFKKVLLGALSVLTLGLFVVTGAKVSAETTNMDKGGTKEVTSNNGEVTELWDFSKNKLSDTYTWKSDDTDSYHPGLSLNSGTVKSHKSGYLSVASGSSFYVIVPSGVISATFGYINQTSYTAKKERWFNIGTSSTYVENSSLVADTSATEKAVTSFSNNKFVVTAGGGEIKATSLWIRYTVQTDEKIHVSYNLNDGLYNGNNVIEEDVLDESGNVNLPVASYMTRTGYSFDGWKDSSNNSISKTETTYNATSSTVLTAQWIANTYTVTYSVNGGTLTPEAKEITYGENYSLDIPTRNNYDFVGWYNGDDLVANTGTWNIASNVTLVAIWSKELDKTVENRKTISFGTHEKNDILTANETIGDFTFYATDSKNGDNFNQQLKFVSGTTISGTEYSLGVSTNGGGSVSSDLKYRAIGFTANEGETIKVVARSNNNSEERPVQIFDSSFKKVKEVNVSSAGGEVTMLASSTGNYYITSSSNITIYSVKVVFETAVPTVELYKDLNSQDNNEFRIVAKIDNLSINGTGLDYIKSVVISINDTTFTRTVSKVYRAVDSATSGRYQSEDNVCYAVMSFTGYENASNSFTIKVTVNYNGGSVVEEIEIPSYANRNI